MLGRRQYRIKILQALYAFFQGGEPRIETAEKNLFQSIEKTYELFYLQFAFLLEFIDYYSNRTEEAKHKFYPTEEEKNPVTRLIENKAVAAASAEQGPGRQDRKVQIQLGRRTGDPPEDLSQSAGTARNTGNTWIRPTSLLRPTGNSSHAFSGNSLHAAPNCFFIVRSEAFTGPMTTTGPRPLC